MPLRRRSLPSAIIQGARHERRRAAQLAHCTREFGRAGGGLAWALFWWLHAHLLLNGAWRCGLDRRVDGALA